MRLLVIQTEGALGWRRRTGYCYMCPVKDQVEINRGRGTWELRRVLHWEILSHDYSGCSISAQFWINEDK